MEQTTKESIAAEKHRLVGMHLGVTDELCGGGWIYYDIGIVAFCALEALQTAVLAMEQIVTGKRLIHSLDVGDFFGYLSEALAVQNGQGTMSESGSMSSIQDEIQGLIDLVNQARKVAKRPRGC